MQATARPCSSRAKVWPWLSSTNSTSSCSSIKRGASRGSSQVARVSLLTARATRMGAAAQELHQAGAGRGGAAGARTHQQGRAQVLLQRGDALRDGRGRHVQQGGGLLQAAAVDGGQEGVAAAGIEVH